MLVYLEVHVSSVLPDPDVDLVAGASTLAQAPLRAARHAARLRTTNCHVTRHVIFLYYYFLQPTKA